MNNETPEKLGPAPSFELERLKTGAKPDATAKFQPGDTVHLVHRDERGERPSGVVLELLKSGRYLVKVGGYKIALGADEIEASGEVSEAVPPKPAEAEQPEPRKDASLQSFKSGAPVIARTKDGEIVTGEYHQPTATPGHSLVKISGSKTATPMRAASDSEIHEYKPKFEAGEEVRFPFARGNADYHGSITDVNEDGTYNVVTGTGRVMTNFDAHRIEHRDGPKMPAVIEKKTEAIKDRVAEQIQANQVKDPATDEIVQATKVKAPDESDLVQATKVKASDESTSAADLVQATKVKASDGDQDASDGGGNSLDAFQQTLDGAGVVEPTPFADGSNAVISLARAAMDPKRRGEHLRNAVISTLGIIPYVGDMAKGVKYGGKAFSKVGKGAKSRKVGADYTRGIGDNIGNVSGIVAQFMGGAGESGGGPPEGITPGAGGHGETGGGGSGSGPSGPPNEPPDNSGSSTSGAGDGENLEGKVKPLTDKVVEFTGYLGKAAAITYTAANSISLMNKVAIDYHQNLTKFNGELAGAYGKLETDRMQRDIKEASELAGPLAGLVESQSELEAALQDFNSPFKQMGADVQMALTELATIGIQILDIIEPISEIYPYIRKRLGLEGILGPTQADSIGWINALRAKADAAARAGRKI